MSRLRWTAILGLLIASFPATPSIALSSDVYVDSLLGDDKFNGQTPAPDNEFTGPVRSLARGVERLQPGDRLILVDRGTVFTGEISLMGPRCSGAHGAPFVIEGNNAVLDGSRPIPFEAWQQAKPGVWKFSPRRKGTYFLLLNGQPFAEHPIPPGAASLPEIPAGSWGTWKGSIYYKVKPGPLQTPRDLNFSCAADGVGLTLLDVHDVVIRNLKVRHYRLDGVNAHDRCTNVILENVTLEQNGRAGLAAGGSSLVGLRDCTVTGNRVTQILVAERAQVELLKTTLGDKPGTPFRITGGHLLIDQQEVRMPRK